MLMPLGGNVFQLSLAVVIGIVWAVKYQRERGQAGLVAGKASFMLGAGYLLIFDHWWPTTASVGALMTWVLSGWLISSLSYELTARIKRILQCRR